MNPFENWFQGLSQRQQGIPQQPGMINPAVMDAIQQQQAQMQMPQSNGSPIEAGSMSAINAMRESMSARPKKDIGFLGRLLNTAGNTLSNYSIASLRSSPSEQARLMGGMMLTPQEREAQERQAQQNQFKENFTLMDYLAKQKQHDENLAEKKRYHNMMNARRSEKDDDINGLKHIEDGVRNESGDYVQSMDRFTNKPSMWTYMSKDIDKRVEQGKYAGDALERIRRVREILKESPDLYNKIDIMLLKKHSDDPGFISQLSVKGIPKKDVANFQEASKLLADLFTLETKSVQAKGLNMFMEKQLKRKVPELTMVPEAIDRAFNPMFESYSDIYEDGIKASDYASQGLWYRKTLKKKDRKVQSSESNDEGSGGLISEIKKSNPGLSEEAIREAMRLEDEGQ